MNTIPSVSDEAAFRVIAIAINRLPMLDLFWPDELQAAWWRCVEALEKMASRIYLQQTPPK